MPRSTRPAAEVAIEVLKVHQLRRENQRILDEINQLREEVTSRKDELDESLKQTRLLAESFDDVQKSIQAHRTQLDALQDCASGADKHVEVLVQEVQGLKAQVLEGSDQAQAARQEQNAKIQKLEHAVDCFRAELARQRKTNTHRIDKFEGKGELKPEPSKILDLEDRAETLVQQAKEGPVAAGGKGDSLQLITSDVHGESALTDPRINESIWQSIKSNEELREDQYSLAAEDVRTLPLAQTRPKGFARPTSLSPLCNKKVPTASFHEARTRQMTQTCQLSKAAGHAGTLSIHHNQSREGSGRRSRQAQALGDSRYAQANTDIPLISGVRKALHSLLHLRQQQDEDLFHFWRRLQGILSSLPANQDIEVVCLRRFAKGLGKSQLSKYMQEWLATSEGVLDDAQDCLVLLSKCGSLLGPNPPCTACENDICSGSRNVPVPGDQQADLDGDRQAGALLGVSEGSYGTAATDRGPSNRSSKKRNLGPKQMDRPNVVTRSAAAQLKRRGEQSSQNMDVQHTKASLPGHDSRQDPPCKQRKLNDQDSPNPQTSHNRHGSPELLGMDAANCAESNDEDSLNHLPSSPPIQRDLSRWESSRIKPDGAHTQTRQKTSVHSSHESDSDTDLVPDVPDTNYALHLPQLRRRAEKRNRWSLDHAPVPTRRARCKTPPPIPIWSLHDGDLPQNSS